MIAAGRPDPRAWHWLGLNVGQTLSECWGVERGARAATTCVWVLP
jgi:hypothetical protein